MKSDIVKIGNLNFKLLYSSQQISKQLDKLAAKIDAGFQKILSQQPHARFLVLGVLNGAYMFVSEITKRLKTPVMVSFIKITSYKGTVSGELTIDSRVDINLFKHNHVLILDDLCDTGKTLVQLSHILKGFQAQSIKTAVLVLRPEKKREIIPDYYALTCSQFIIGFGLDYNLYGRQYPQIYQKIDL